MIEDTDNVEEYDNLNDEWGHDEWFDEDEEDEEEDIFDEYWDRKLKRYVEILSYEDEKRKRGNI